MKPKLKKKSKTPKRKIALRKMFSIKQLYYSVYLVGICVAVYVGYFVYENYYQTVAQAQEIADLKKEVAPESINIERVDSILDSIDNKSTTTNSIIDPNINDPFDPFEGQFDNEESTEVGLED